MDAMVLLKFLTLALWLEALKLLYKSQLYENIFRIILDSICYVNLWVHDWNK